MSVISFDPREHTPQAGSAGRRMPKLRRGPRGRRKGLPVGLRDGLIIVTALAILLAFSSLLHYLIG